MEKTTDLIDDVTANHVAASDPTTAPNALAWLATDPQHCIREAVVLNPNAPALALDALSLDVDPHIRAHLAKRHDLPITAEERLAMDADDVVLGNLVQNPSIRPETTLLLTSHPSSTIRSLLAESSTDPSILDRLSLDEDDLVRHTVLRNPETSSETLARQPVDEVPTWQVVSRSH